MPNTSARSPHQSVGKKRQGGIPLRVSVLISASAPSASGNGRGDPTVERHRRSRDNLSKDMWQLVETGNGCKENHATNWQPARVGCGSKAHSPRGEGRGAPDHSIRALPSLVREEEGWTPLECGPHPIQARGRGGEGRVSADRREVGGRRGRRWSGP